MCVLPVSIKLGLIAMGFSMVEAAVTLLSFAFFPRSTLLPDS